MGSNLVGNEIGTLFFYNVVLEGMWEGNRKGEAKGGWKTSYNDPKWELNTLKAQFHFIFKTHLKDTFKSQNLGKGKGFGSVVNWYREEHGIERVSWVLGVQGLKQEGDCESRVLSFSILITNSRLGELLLVFCC